MAIGALRFAEVRSGRPVYLQASPAPLFPYFATVPLGRMGHLSLPDVGRRSMMGALCSTLTCGPSDAPGSRRPW